MADATEKTGPTEMTLAGRRIGLVGLGLMGEPMARNLAAAGATLSVWNRTREKAEALAAEVEGITAAACPRDVATASEITIVMVTDADAVETVVFDTYEQTYGVVQGIAQGALVIDMGTTSVLRTRDFAERLRTKGADWVDAPVSGGTTAAQAGSLTIMAGGSDAGFARALLLFEVMGQRITHVGPIGAGQIAKSANQMIVGLTIGAVAEAFTLAKSAGVEPARIREALMGGFAHSRVLELHGERMVTGDFAPRARCSIQAKDMREGLQLAASTGVTLPALAANAPLWQEMLDAGMADLDHSALILAIDKSESASASGDA
jgi:3-hydroxyisobutyrate dehydrogenase-like beta-hydroxyacid dehydrogenase